MANKNWVARWFKPWPFHPRIVGGHQQPFKRVTFSPSQKRSPAELTGGDLLYLRFTYRYHWWKKRYPSPEDGSLKIPFFCISNKKSGNWPRRLPPVKVEPYVSVLRSQKSLFGVVFFCLGMRNIKLELWAVGILLIFSHYSKDSFYERLFWITAQGSFFPISYPERLRRWSDPPQKEDFSPFGEPFLLGIYFDKVGLGSREENGLKLLL